MDDITKAFASAFKSRRLKYRPVDSDDKEFMHANFWLDPVSLGLSLPKPLQIYNRQVSDQQVDGMMKHTLMAVMILAPSAVNASESPGEQQFSRVGFISLSGNMPPATTSVSIAIADKFQGCGYGREAMNWAIDWAFGYGNLHRVEIATGGYNERAIHLYKSLGFVEEGRKRKAFYMNHKWHDQVDMAMLDEDYYKIRKAETEAGQVGESIIKLLESKTLD